MNWNTTIFGMSPLELVATVLGLLSVWLTVKQNVWCWPIGVLMVALYAWIFFHAKLYADAGLQVVYFVLQFYGWYEWLHGGENREELPVTRASRTLLIYVFILGAVGVAALGTALHRWTDQQVSYLDSTITVFSLIAQWMLARKLLENWLFWIGIDVLAVGVYAYKGLYPTSVLYGVFLVMASVGYAQWRRTLPGKSSAEPVLAIEPI